MLSLMTNQLFDAMFRLIPPWYLDVEVKLEYKTCEFSFTGLDLEEVWEQFIDFKRIANNCKIKVVKVRFRDKVLTENELAKALIRAGYNGLYIIQNKSITWVTEFDKFYESLKDQVLINRVKGKLFHGR